MTNTANIRFEPSNVAYVAVDLETHEMSGGVMDETTGTFYPVGGGGGGGSPIRVCKVNITNESTTDDLYVDYYGGGITLGSHLLGPAGATGTLMPYVPSANAMNDAGDYKNRGFIAEKNGGTGVIYLINSGWNARMGDDWVWSTGLFTVSKSDADISIEIVSNVSKEDGDETSWDYSLTDDTMDGEINITISGS